MLTTLLRLLPVVVGMAAGYLLRRASMAEHVLVNVTDVQVPSAIADPIKAFGSLTGALISVGSAFCSPAGCGDPQGPAHRRHAAGHRARGRRVVVLAFGLAGIDRTIVLLLIVAPVGFASVTFASLEKLDVRLATSALSLSMVFSLVLSIVISLTLG
jgi:predicted permease